MPIQTIDTTTAKTWQDQGEAIIIDVREPGEHSAMSIPGALLLPLKKVCKAALPDTGGKKIVMHCKTGSRTNSACKKLLAEDPNLEIYELGGGIDAWNQANYEVNTSGKLFLPIDQQVQLTIGMVVVLSVVLGYLIHPGFLLLAVFFGLGLVNAGLTGWCGLGLLMAQMPWNQRLPK